MMLIPMVSVAGCCWLSWMDCPYQHLQIFGRRGIKLLLFKNKNKSWCWKWSLWFQHLFKAINVIPLVLKAGHTWSFSSINLYRLIMYPCFQLWQYDFELVFVKNNHEFVHENMKKPDYVDLMRRLGALGDGNQDLSGFFFLYLYAYSLNLLHTLV